MRDRDLTTTDRGTRSTAPGVTAKQDVQLPSGIEWPTVAVAVAIWTLLIGAFVTHTAVPWWITVPVLAVGSGWFASLQHEVAHGHPTPWKAVNILLAGPPIGFVYPLARFTDLHLAHHLEPALLTEPGIDNESRYCSPEEWARAGSLKRLALRIERTLVGHLTVGAIRNSLDYMYTDLRATRHDARLRLIWARHLVGVAFVLAVVLLTGFPLVQYLVGVVYGRVFFTGLRTFAEHRAVVDGTRCAVVRAGPAMSIIFLNNNLHHTHHTLPGAAWYRLPRLSEELGSDELARRGAGLYTGGYLELARRYAVRPFCQPVHPV